MDAATISIEPYGRVASPAVTAEIDDIFFSSSGTQSFATIADRTTFHNRWLGRYLADEPHHAFVAMTHAGAACGYLVGSLTDPARSDRYRDVGYFGLLSADTAQYPAHVHVNVARAHRSSGIGARLVTAFADHALLGGACGVHVVTGANARNVTFYAACGFAPVRHFDWRGHGLVMLGRLLLPAASPSAE